MLARIQNTTKLRYKDFMAENELASYVEQDTKDQAVAAVVIGYLDTFTAESSHC